MKLALARTAAPAAPTHDAALAPLAHHPEIVALDGRIRALTARKQQAHERAERARRAHAAPPPTRSPLERAELLAAGGTIPSAEPAAEIKAADDEALILQRGIIALNVEREAVVSRLNYEASLKFQARHIASLRALDAAIEAAHTALADLHHIAQELAADGYSPSVVVLPANVPAALYRLGDPNDTRSDAWRFRQWLKKNFGEAK